MGHREKGQDARSYRAGIPHLTPQRTAYDKILCSVEDEVADCETTIRYSLEGPGVISGDAIVGEHQKAGQSSRYPLLVIFSVPDWRALLEPPCCMQDYSLPYRAIYELSSGQRQWDIPPVHFESCPATSSGEIAESEMMVPAQCHRNLQYLFQATRKGVAVYAGYWTTYKSCCASNNNRCFAAACYVLV